VPERRCSRWDLTRVLATDTDAACGLVRTVVEDYGLLVVPGFFVVLGVAGMATRRFLALSALGTVSFELLLAAVAMGVFELF